MTADLRELLELASDDVPDLDLASEAWEEAGRRHRAVVRRTVIGAGGVAALGGLWVVLRDRAPAAAPTPTAAPATVAADGRLPTAKVGDVTVYLAPDPPAEAALPRYPRAAELAIPRHLGPGDPAIRARLGPGGLSGVAEPLRAVFLVVAEGGGYHPVLFAPNAPFEVEVPGVRVNQWEGVQSALGPRSISDDRHRVVIPQPGRVVVLDARDGSVREIEVPDPTLSFAGWARDRTTVVTRGRDDGWLVDVPTGDGPSGDPQGEPRLGRAGPGRGRRGAAVVRGVG